MQQQTGCTFFTVSDSGYFLGLVGLINSLRLTGHQSPIVVADCGLTSDQRALLKGHVTLLQLPEDVVINPGQYKAFAHLLKPEGVVVIIDSDMLVTKSLEPVVRLAILGKICLFPDPESDRWFGEWQEIFELADPPRRQTYGCSGFVAFSAAFWPDLLCHWWHACARINGHPTYQEGVHDGPTAQGDQDALNAILMSTYPAGAMHLLPEGEQVFRWDFPAVTVTDRSTLGCRHRGIQPAILHACMVPKPWQQRGVRRNAYVELLRYALTSGDNAVRLPRDSLPLWAQAGLLPEISLGVLSASNMFNRDDGIVPRSAYAVARRIKRRIIRWRRA